MTTAADLDSDGRLELVARTDDGARVVRVKGQRQYHWQAIRPRAITATGDQRINSFGIGGEIEIRTGLHAQKQTIAAPVAHFGLGEKPAASYRVVVDFPVSKKRVVKEGLKPGQALVVREE